MLRRYERLLEQRHLADPAAVLRLALTSMEHEGHRMPDTLGPDVVVLVPGVSTRCSGSEQTGLSREAK
jgi:hypothetical protein